MKIGLDFGTAYTKIAFLEANGEPGYFHHPGRQGDRIIPSAVAYCHTPNRPPVIQVGKSAISAAQTVRAARLFANFRASLALENPPGWNYERSPREVTRDYLERIIISAVDSFEKSVEKIDGLVVALPQGWMPPGAPPSPAAVRLVKILRDELHLPVQFAESEPVCAAALLAFNLKIGSLAPDAPPCNVLVCDAGGSGFSAAVCQVRGPEITVLAAESSPAVDPGQGGTAFDHNLLNLLYEKYHHQRPPKNSTDYLELFLDFEQAKIDHSQNVRSLVADLAGIPLLADTELYKVNNLYSVELQHMGQAFQPIGQGIAAVLLRLKDRCPIDRVVIVGGFGQFPLVENIVRQILAVDAGGPPLDLSINREDRPFAAAFGAMLLANGILKSRLPIADTLGVFSNQKVNGVWQKGQLPILRAGVTRPGMLVPEFALDENGQPETLEIRANGAQPLPVYIQPRGAGPAQAVALPGAAEFPPPGRYKVGALIDPADQVTLFFESADGGKSYPYPLGNFRAMHSDQGNEA